MLEHLTEQVSCCWELNHWSPKNDNRLLQRLKMSRGNLCAKKSNVFLILQYFIYLRTSQPLNFECWTRTIIATVCHTENRLCSDFVWNGEKYKSWTTRLYRAIHDLMSECYVRFEWKYWSEFFWNQPVSVSQWIKLRWWCPSNQIPFPVIDAVSTFFYSTCYDNIELLCSFSENIVLMQKRCQIKSPLY